MSRNWAAESWVIAPSSYGLNIKSLVVYLLVYQHVPVVGTLHAAFQQPHRSSEPVTLVATSR